MLRYYKIAKWRTDKRFNKLLAQVQTHKASINIHIKSVWFKLSTAQKLYLTALIALILFQSGSLCALFTMTALVIEFWPKFNKLWHSLAGKALILIFYATIANFVLASASGIVNEVTLVSATDFNYTHNFATLLYLPPSALLITIITLLLLQLLLPFYIIALLLIKPFGSKQVKFISQSYSPLLTAVVRFCLTILVFINLAALAEGISTDALIEKIHNLGFDRSAETASTLTKNQKLLPKTNSGVNAKFIAQLDREEGDSQPIKEVNTSIEAKGYFKLSKWLIAEFAFNFEGNTHSRCNKAEGSKVVELNDYEIVEITPDNTMPYSYKFIVKACESPAFKPMLNRSSTN